MPEYRVLRGVVVASGRHVWPGEWIELDEAEGDALCLQPGAVLARVPEAPPTAPEPGSGPPPRPRRRLPRADD